MTQRQDPERQDDTVAAEIPAQNVQEVARYELLEERAVVNREREVTGRVRVRRDVERHTEMVRVELVTETLVIEVLPDERAGDLETPGEPIVLLNGEALAPGETREIVTYREEAVVTKRPVIAEEVRILKRQVRETREMNVTLGREVLRVEDTSEESTRAASVRNDRPDDAL